MTQSKSEYVAKQILDLFLGKYRKIDNFRPKWLGELELDRFYPDLKIAVEFQGNQHYRYIPDMHRDEESFAKRLQFDTLKRQLCEKQGIKIYYLNIFDLNEDRVRSFIRQIVKENNLEKINLNQEIDPNLLNWADKLSRFKKPRRDRDPLFVRAIRSILKGL